MSANDQRSRGQPSHVSNGSGGKEEDAYLQQQPPHPMRAWGEQASDGGYGAGPMSTAVSDSFFPNYYPPNMSYPFMSQGMGGSEGAWSSGADTMFGMGYDYSNMYSGFGFPFNNWDYSGDYWGNSQPVRKDQRGYAAEDAYYPPEMIPADSYGMVNGGAPPPTATATPAAAPATDSQEHVANVEQGIREMHLAYRKDNVIPQQQQNQRQPPQQQQQTPHHLQHVVAEGFGEPSFMMPPSPVSATVASSGGQSSISGGNHGSCNTGGGDQNSGQSSSKKTSWAAIASQPARPQLQMRPRTIPRAPVHPGKSHNMDIGTWDTRGNPSRQVPMTMSQPLPNQPPSSIAARYSRQPLISQRQSMPPPTASVTISNSSNASSASGAGNSNLNSSSSYNSTNNSGGIDSGSGSSNSAVNDSSNGTNISNDSGSVVTVIGSGADSNNSNNMSNSSGANSSSSSAYSGGYSSNASGNTPESTNKAVVNVNASMNGIHGSGGDSSSSQAPVPVADSATSDKSSSSSFYNPKEFVLNHKSARYFIIKSYSEDDIHRSIKYAVWCSTDHGNRRLDAAFREREGKGPVYLIFSVNGSGHFCGVAQMMTPVDYNKTTGIWHQDKWKGQIEVKWVYVKDVPNSQLRHIRLENNENKPVTNSRDTQEVPPEKGKQVLRIMHSYKATTSIFDDFSHYEKRQEEDRLLSVHREQRGGGSHAQGGGGGDRRGGDSDYHSGGGNRDRGDQHQPHQNRGDRGDRDNHHNHHRSGNNNDHHHNYRNDYNRGGDREGGGRDNRDHHHRYDGGRGGDSRSDNRDRGGPRGGFDREIRGRPGGMNDRDNRRGGFRQH